MTWDPWVWLAAMSWVLRAWSLGGLSSLGGGQEGLWAALQRQLSAAQIQLTGFKAGTRSCDAGADWIQLAVGGGRGKNLGEFGGEPAPYNRTPRCTQKRAITWALAHGQGARPPWRGKWEAPTPLSFPLWVEPRPILAPRSQWGPRAWDTPTQQLPFAQHVADDIYGGFQESWRMSSCWV